MSEEVRTFRIGVPGPNGHTITAGDWTDTRSRLANVEKLANTINPYTRTSSAYLSTQSHGLGGEAVSVAIPAERMIWTPIFVPAAFTSFAMSVYVSVPQPNALLRLGLYDRTSALVSSFLTTNATTVGWKFHEVTAGVAVDAGLNWLCVHVNNIAGVEIYQLTNARSIYHSATSMVRYAGFRLTYPWGDFPATISQEGPTVDVPYLGIRIG